MIPRATYRLQFHAGFTFDHAADLADYLAELGVSHVYASPYLQAAPGSTHGYDVIDPNSLDEELGGENGHRRFCLALEKNGLGQVLDIVPNHMSIASSRNRWWWDVLEFGMSSLFASYFDVDWEPPEDRLSNKILLPILGDHYGRVIDAGQIQLERKADQFCIRYFDHILPVAPRSLVEFLERAVLSSTSDTLTMLVDALAGLIPENPDQRELALRRHRDCKTILTLLFRLLGEDPRAAGSVDAAVNEVNRDAAAMDRLLEAQNYRLAFWRTAERDLGYRRFFDINTLVGLRNEDESIFNETHYLILGWLRQEVLDGIRVDHPDGLPDPELYLSRLRKAAPRAWIIVEKILQPGESLPVTWPVEGTTGYDFLNLVGALFIDQAGEEPLNAFYTELCGGPVDYQVLAREKKLQVMRDILASDINRLTQLMVKICEKNRYYRDYTRHEVSQALQEVIACLGVYRTYVRTETRMVSEQDRSVIMEAVACAKRERPDIDSNLFDFLKDIFLLTYPEELELRMIKQFQQLSATVMAKGIEDTAFYNYHRLVSLNEVGGDPSRFGISVADFHAQIQQKMSIWPHSMLSTSTHDSKRSEDVRARLALLSEIPQRWIQAVRRWRELNARFSTDNFPEPDTEYAIYQNLVGAWPISRQRFLTFMEKFMREAKRQTSWTRPNAVYEKVLLDFVKHILNHRAFIQDLDDFVGILVGPGRINALAQTLIKLTAPGVPDIYQGMELWDLSLVDPDNRRPVDFRLRRTLLAEIKRMSLEEILGRMDQGLPKLWVIRQALALRNQLPDVFMQGSYLPLEVAGMKAGHAVAYLRSQEVAVLAPRLVMGLEGQWGDATVMLPPGTWHNVLSNNAAFAGGSVEIARILDIFPVALMKKT